MRVFTEDESKAILNFVIANGNLQLAIARDDPAEIIKAVNFLTTAQHATGVALYTTAQLSGLLTAAEAKITERQSYYMGASNAN